MSCPVMAKVRFAFWLKFSLGDYLPEEDIDDPPQRRLSVQSAIRGRLEEKLEYEAVGFQV